MTFFCTIRSARQGHGAWAEIDARACEETRAERDRLVAAFRGFNGWRSGTGPSHITR
jgi:hypothetical protein